VRTFPAARAQADVDDGRKLFNKCKVCHMLEPGKNAVGPSLSGIVGRKAGSVEGYKYSPAMASSGLTWDEATLDRYLKDPKGVVPNTKMIFPGLKDDKERHDVIAFLKAEAK